MKLNIETIKEFPLQFAYAEVIHSVFFDIVQQITGSDQVGFSDTKYLITHAHFCQNHAQIKDVLEKQFKTSVALIGYDFEIEIVQNPKELKFEHDEKYVKYFEVKTGSSYYEKGLVMNERLSKDDILNQLNNTLEIRVDYEKKPLPF